MRQRRKTKRSPLAQALYTARYRLGAHVLRAVVAVLPRLPMPWMHGITRGCARVAYSILWRYRARMEENISLVFPDLSQEERTRLVKAAWLNFARGVLDTTLTTTAGREQIIARVTVEGEEHLRRALEEGRGVLALSAHFGSFTMIGARLAAAGYPFSVVVKPPADEELARLMDGYRARIGIHTVAAKPRREAVRGILKALRQNRIVLVIADEFKSGDIMVDFLGLKVPAARGPATLALRTGAVTLPMFVTRDADDALRLSIGEPIAPVERDELEESVIATTLLYTRYIEAAIRRNPEQWNWLGLPRRDGKRKSREEIARARSRTRRRRPIRYADRVNSGPSL